MKTIPAFIFALMVAAPVAAQSIIPREGPASTDEEGTVTGDDARKVMDQFAVCVLDRRGKMVIDALAMPSDSPEQNELFKYFSKTECIASAHMQFNGTAFRGSLYKALVRKKFGRKEIFPAPVAGGGSEAIPQTNEVGGAGEAGRLRFASCVIHKDPANARVAIVATAGSPNEKAALAALANVYGQCLYQGETFRFNKVRLIGLLAEAYYRDATALAAASTAQ